MKTRRHFAALMGAALLLAAGQAWPATAPPQRIVSTAPSITELLFALGLGDRVVGVDRFTHYPPEAMKKTQIGDYATPNLEVITSLKPDLVIIPTNPVQLRERLETMHLKVLEIEQEGLAALFHSFHQVGEATGTVAQADALTARVRGRFEAVRAKSAKAKPTRMMFVVARSPSHLDGLMVVGGGSYLNEVIHAAGGANVFEDAQAAYPKVTLEEVLSRNPDVIIDMGDMADTTVPFPEREAHDRATVTLWTQMGTLAAVRARRVHPVASDVYMIPGPRIADAAEEMYHLLHPERGSR